MHDRSEHEIHLVTPGEHHVPEKHPNTRLSLGEYFADVVISRDQDVCFWIVQRIGSADIVDWGHAADFETAQRTAQTHMENLVRYEREKLQQML